MNTLIISAAALEFALADWTLADAIVCAIAAVAFLGLLSVWRGC